MNTIKQCWCTQHEETGQVALSLESARVEEGYQRINFHESLTPTHPTKEHPLRHVVVLSLFTEEDINVLGQLLDKYRTDLE